MTKAKEVDLESLHLKMESADKRRWSEQKRLEASYEKARKAWAEALHKACEAGTLEAAKLCDKHFHNNLNHYGSLSCHKCGSVVDYNSFSRSCYHPIYWTDDTGRKHKVGEYCDD